MHCFVDPTPIKKGMATNQYGNLIVNLNDSFIINSQVFIVNDIIGTGTFSDVYKVINTSDCSIYALKVYKINYEAYSNQEIMFLSQIQQYCDKNTIDHIGKMITSFEYKKHMIILMDLYEKSLYNLMAESNFVNFHLSLVQKVAREMVTVLRDIHRLGIIHSDIKPENIVVDLDENTHLIDFGCAQNEFDIFETYCQSRYYRAPEVCMGLKPTTKIDVWSLACTLMELHAGFPLFPGYDNLDMLSLFELFLGKIPPKMIRQVSGKELDYFNPDNTLVKHTGPTGKDYYKQGINTINKIVSGITFSSTYSEHEEGVKKVFIDFINSMLVIDPDERPTIDIVSTHPFLTIDI